MTRKLWKPAENVDLRQHEDPDLPHDPELAPPGGEEPAKRSWRRRAK